MADTIGRVIKRAPAGGGSTSDLFAAYRALGSGTFQAWMTSDLNHLGDESTYRTLRSVPGFTSVDQPSPTAPAINAELTIADFDWSSSVLAPNPANVCLGTHVIHRNAVAASAWPNIVLRARIETLATSPFADYIGAILVMCPGRWRAPQSGDAFAWDVIPANGGAWEDLVLTLPMSGTAALTAASDHSVPPSTPAKAQLKLIVEEPAKMPTAPPAPPTELALVARLRTSKLFTQQIAGVPKPDTERILTWIAVLVEAGGSLAAADFARLCGVRPHQVGGVVARMGVLNADGFAIVEHDVAGRRVVLHKARLISQFGVTE